MLGEVLRQQRVEHGVDPFAVLEVRLPLAALADEAGSLGMRTGALVEGVDLELEPVVAELLEQMTLEQSRRLVGQPTAAKARVDREPLEPGDPARLVRDVEAEHPGRLSVQLDHEAPEAGRLRARALGLRAPLGP